jgi:hypothetical protein
VGRALLAGLLLPVAAGCASGGRQAAPQAVARAFDASWARHDGAALCRLLAPETRAEVAQSAKKPCAQGILDEDLPSAGQPTATQVWGRAAQVELAGDTLFLSRFPTGWKVTAAGCTRQADKPYDCQLSGG